MHEFHHFTTAIGLKGILDSGRILATDTYVNEAIKLKSVCLTTDLSPEGHGLPDGRKITDKQALVFGHRCFTINNKTYCLNHREFRLKINPQNLDIIAAVDFHLNDMFMIKLLAASAYYPHGEAEEQVHLEEIAKMVKDPTFLGKSPTWYYCLQDIPLASLVLIEKLSIDGSYQTVSSESIYSHLNKNPFLQG